MKINIICKCGRQFGHEPKHLVQIEPFDSDGKAWAEKESKVECPECGAEYAILARVEGLWIPSGDT